MKVNAASVFGGVLILACESWAGMSSTKTMNYKAPNAKMEVSTAKTGMSAKSPKSSSSSKSMSVKAEPENVFAKGSEGKGMSKKSAKSEGKGMSKKSAKSEGKGMSKKSAKSEGKGMSVKSTKSESKGKGMSMKSKKSPKSESKGKGKGMSMKSEKIRMMGKGKGKGLVSKTPTGAPTAMPYSATNQPADTSTTGTPITTTGTQTSAPTSRPTSSPTQISLQTLDVCVPDSQGVFGSTEGTEEFVEFGYALETTPGATNAQVAAAVQGLEDDIGSLVVASLFEECASSRRLQEITHRRLATAVGLSPKPDDVLLSDRNCPSGSGEGNRCDVVRSRMTIYLSEASRRLQDFESADQIRTIVREAMNSGDLNDTQPNVERVSYVDLDTLTDDDVTDRDGDGDDRILDRSWLIAIIVGAGGLVCVICGIYACNRRRSRVEPEERGLTDKRDKDDGEGERQEEESEGEGVGVDEVDNSQEEEDVAEEDDERSDYMDPGEGSERASV